MSLRFHVRTASYNADRFRCCLVVSPTRGEQGSQPLYGEQRQHPEHRRREQSCAYFLAQEGAFGKGRSQGWARSRVSASAESCGVFDSSTIRDCGDKESWERQAGRKQGAISATVIPTSLSYLFPLCFVRNRETVSHAD